MADLNELTSTGMTKIIGSASDASEQTPVQSTTAGGLHASLRDGTGNEITSTLTGAKRGLDVNFTQPLLDRSGSGTVAALNAAVTANTQGSSSLTLNVTGTWVATLVIEGTNDSSIFFAIPGIDIQSDLALTSTTTNRSILVPCGGYLQVRIRASLYTSGTVTVTYNASAGVNQPEASVGNNNATPPLQSTQIAGVFNSTTLIPVQVDNQGRLVTSAITGFGADFSFGDVTTAASTKVVVRRTAYTEQTTNAQRSIVSTSATDAAAGTGARTVAITYYTVTGTGPFIEIITLNGTVAVNTVATDICYVENMIVVTAGSTGSNAGTINFKSTTAGGGVTVGSISPTDNRTFWAHHYIPLGKVCNITGVSVGHNGTTVGSGALFSVNSLALNVTNAVDAQVTDFIRLYGQSSTFARSYTSPVKVSGPARLTVTVTPETSTSTVYRASIDFFQP